MTFAAIVASARPRAGKTLLARLLAENFRLSGQRPDIFDTDSAEQGLWSCFPKDAIVVEFDHVPEQMRLFEALSAPSEHPRVVEISQHTARKFFEVMHASDYVREARAQGVEPVVFFIPSTDPQSFEYGRQLHEHLGDCLFVLTQNSYLGATKILTRLSSGYRALEGLRPRLVLPTCDHTIADAIADPALSFSEFVRDPRTDLSLTVRDATRDWLLRAFKQIYGAIQSLETLRHQRQSLYHYDDRP